MATACKGGRLLKTKDMKALDKMDNLDKAGLLCKLFPAELENLQNAIKTQCDYFLQNETAFRECWYQKGFFTAEFWYRLVQNAQKGIDKTEPLWKRPHWFTDHFFDGHHSIFAIHSLIEYTEDAQCNPQLKQAIHLLFGSDKFLQITLNDK
ncbi:hypothetical protein [Chryseobacterium potabilaquae]|uniref:Uncharacterized protein n=1 Tax=Chryseobacterium potabilaquae TaxID=2675057 RepID=A0A6N4WZM1_9FLAO|nr:hypothetical protein [Chryseobacterium potabilaquae]CAA7193918.1 hypothetical protein CHRY9293_00297 [Chryseobacterium potabilaquae]